MTIIKATEAAQDGLTFVTPDDLAQKLDLSRKVIIDRYAKQPGFPAPVTGWRKPRWLESEVLKFMRRKSVQNANNRKSS